MSGRGHPPARSLDRLLDGSSGHDLDLPCQPDAAAGATLTAARAQPRDDGRDRRRLRQWSDEREHLETLGWSGAPGQDRPARADEISKIRVREHVAQLEQVSLPPSQARGRVAVERVEQQPNGTARVRAATHLGQVQHGEVVDRRPPLLGEGVWCPRAGSRVRRRQARRSRRRTPAAGSRSPRRGRGGPRRSRRS